MENCENLAKCAFFIEFKGNPEVIKKGWIRMFCEDQNKSELCLRKQYKKQHGIPPATNMSPTGNFLSES